MRPHQMVLSAWPGWCAGSALSDHLGATRLGKGVRKTRAKGVASVKPRAGRLPSTNSLAAGGAPGGEEESLASHGSG